MVERCRVHCQPVLALYAGLSSQPPRHRTGKCLVPPGKQLWQAAGSGTSVLHTNAPAQNSTAGPSGAGSSAALAKRRLGPARGASAAKQRHLNALTLPAG